MNIPRYTLWGDEAGDLVENLNEAGKWCKLEDVELALAQPIDHLSMLREWRDGLKALAEALEGLFTPCQPGCTECIRHRLDGLIAVMEAHDYPSRNDPVGIEKKTH